jgi:hypothetical protein
LDSIDESVRNADTIENKVAAIKTLLASKLAATCRVQEKRIIIEGRGVDLGPLTACPTCRILTNL